MKENHLITPRTARFYTLGELKGSTQNVWIVLHGYGQLAREFITLFETIENDKNFVIAPEGLNRFYSRHRTQKVVATWMTSEDRENEIKDYIAYLDNLYLCLKLHKTKARIIVLGFSQGVATASRWVHATPNRVDDFVIYAGEIAKELLIPFSEKIKSLTLTYVTGKSDPLIAREEHLKVYELMKGLNADILEFDGGHEVLPEVINDICKKIALERF